MSFAVALQIAQSRDLAGGSHQAYAVLAYMIMAYMAMAYIGMAYLVDGI